jgi:hypothetical protein
VSVAGAVQTLTASQAALEQVASPPTAWRALTELDAAALAVVAADLLAWLRLLAPSTTTSG